MKTHGGFKRRGLNTRGGKVNVGPVKIPRSTRNIRQPIRFIDDSDSEEVSSDESRVMKALTRRTGLARNVLMMMA